MVTSPMGVVDSTETAVSYRTGIYPGLVQVNYSPE